MILAVICFWYTLFLAKIVHLVVISFPIRYVGLKSYWTERNGNTLFQNKKITHAHACARLSRHIPHEVSVFFILSFMQLPNSEITHLLALTRTQLLRCIIIIAVQQISALEI